MLLLWRCFCFRSRATVMRGHGHVAAGRSDRREGGAADASGAKRGSRADCALAQPVRPMGLRRPLSLWRCGYAAEGSSRSARGISENSCKTALCSRRLLSFLSDSPPRGQTQTLDHQCRAEAGTPRSNPRTSAEPASKGRPSQPRPPRPDATSSPRLHAHAPTATRAHDPDRPSSPRARQDHPARPCR